jgi:hypothetical protein
MTKHTPGPWVAEPEKLHDGKYHISGEKPQVWNNDRSQLIASAHRTLTNGRDKQAEANARLIAAAPDLLTALKDNRLMLYAWKGARQKIGLPDDHGELNETIARMEATIAKAESAP